MNPPKLSRKQERVIAALLIEPTMADVVRVSGVSQPTIWRWQQLPDFREQYLAARRQVVEAAIAQLQQASGEAVEALRRNLVSGVPAVEVRAAEAVLNHAIKAVEVMDLELRLSELERRQAPLEPSLVGYPRAQPR